MTDYPRPYGATSTVVIFTYYDGYPYVCLGLRKSTAETYPGMECLPGGFIKINEETAEEAAVREVQEETGMVMDCLVQTHTVTDPKLDPRGHVINICFSAHVFRETAEAAKAGDDLESLRWIPYDEAMDLKLAFHHEDIIRKAFEYRQR